MAPRKGKKAKASDTGTIDMGDRDYKRVKVRDAEGKLKHTANNGDAVAKAMLVYTSKGGDLKELADKNGLTEKFKALTGANNGLRRMSLGVMLRALVRNGTPVKIGSIKVEKLTQKVEVPNLETSRKKAA